MQPEGGHPTQKIIFVNGIMNSPGNEYASMQEIANHANAEVVGVHNATEGFFKDFLQCVKDKLGIGHSPAVSTLSNTLYHELISDGQQPINLMAHSQGAIITSRALEDVRNRLHEAGLSSQQIDARMSRINVDTFGGASETFPDGPHYNHYVNDIDPVPLVGQESLVPEGGAGAQLHEFHAFAGNPHSFVDVYLKHWQSQFPRDAPEPPQP